MNFADASSYHERRRGRVFVDDPLSSLEQEILLFRHNNIQKFQQGKTCFAAPRFYLLLVFPFYSRRFGNLCECLHMRASYYRPRVEQPIGWTGRPNKRSFAGRKIKIRDKLKKKILFVFTVTMYELSDKKPHTFYSIQHQMGMLDLVYSLI